MIRGLTLRHPWAWAFQHGKDVENRTWQPERQGGKVGMYLALHGGSDKVNAAYANEIMDALVWMMQRGCEIPSIPPHNLISVVQPGIVAIARLEAVTTTDPSPWAAQGQYHWRMADVLVLSTPVPHKGAQGLWALEAEALAQVRQAWKERMK